GEAHAVAADQEVRVAALEPCQRQLGQLLLRVAHARAHQLVAPEPDDEVAPVREQPQLLAAGDLRCAEKLAGDHRMLELHRRPRGRPCTPHAAKRKTKPTRRPSSGNSRAYLETNPEFAPPAKCYPGWAVRPPTTRCRPRNRPKLPADAPRVRGEENSM